MPCPMLHTSSSTAHYTLMPTWPVPHHSLDIADLLSLREGIEALAEFFKHSFTFKKFTHPTPRKETDTSDFSSLFIGLLYFFMFTITFTLTPIVDFYQSVITPYQFVRYSDILHFDTTDTTWGSAGCRRQLLPCLEFSRAEHLSTLVP